MIIKDGAEIIELLEMSKEKDRVIESQRQYIDALLNALEQLAIEHDLEDEVDNMIQRINRG